MSAALHRHTPKLSVIDGRGLPVRQVDYLRIKENDEPQADITRQQHDAAGRAVAQWDPRLFEKVANLTSVYNLSAIPLLTDSVDSGWRLNLPGEAGQSLQCWDQRGSRQQTDYDLQLRPTAIQERASGQAEQTVERFTYGDSSSDSARHNQCGRLLRHNDPAGSLFIDEYGVTGSPLQQTRRFLKEPDPPNWPETPQEQGNWLEPVEYQTKCYYSAVGEMLSQTDAKEHRQHFAFDVAGQLKTIHLQVKGATDKQPILESLQYDAAGQIETQTAGNGVISTAVFNPPDGRLNELKAAKGSTTHQHLGYEYDPVGNVTTISDHTHVIRYFANQRVDGARTFTYDSLYQLRTATGHESIGANTQPDLPGLITPIDLSALGNYTQTYEYDSGKNLTKLTHVSPIPGQGHTRTLKIAEHSNRCLSWQKGDSTPQEMDFDEDGNLQTLQPAGQALRWNPRNQLQRVTQVSREDGEDDFESYAYDGKGNRLRKRQSAKAGSVTHVREVRYLSGLEVRTLDDSEELHVITLQAGRCSVRCLHWVKGKPDGIDANQLRYSLDDQLASSSLELDKDAAVISHEGYYPYGGTAWWAARSRVDADYKTIRYSGKERDASGLYYYGIRYYAPWLGRWLSADPMGAVDGLNLFAMVRNNSVTYYDVDGRMLRGIARNNPAEESSENEPQSLSGNPLSSTVENIGNAEFHLPEISPSASVNTRILEPLEELMEQLQLTGSAERDNFISVSDDIGGRDMIAGGGEGAIYDSLDGNYVYKKFYGFSKHTSIPGSIQSEADSFNAYYGPDAAKALVENGQVYIKMTKLDGIPLSKITKNTLSVDAADSLLNAFNDMEKKDMYHQDVQNHNFLYSEKDKKVYPVDMQVEPYEFAQHSIDAYNRRKAQLLKEFSLLIKR